MGSLQEALQQAGLGQSKSKSQSKTTSKQRGGSADRPSSQQKQRREPSSSELDLAKAYRLRQLAEKEEVEQKKQAKLALQEARRQRNLALEQQLKDQVLNDASAECARYFEYRGRIRKVMCTESQREALNDGQLAVMIHKGVACLITQALAAQLSDIAPDLIPDLKSKADASEQTDSDDYPPVPDDLMW